MCKPPTHTFLSIFSNTMFPILVLFSPTSWLSRRACQLYQCRRLKTTHASSNANSPSHGERERVREWEYSATLVMISTYRSWDSNPNTVAGLHFCTTKLWNCRLSHWDSQKLTLKHTSFPRAFNYCSAKITTACSFRVPLNDRCQTGIRWTRKKIKILTFLSTYYSVVLLKPHYWVHRIGLIPISSDSNQQLPINLNVSCDQHWKLYIQ